MATVIGPYHQKQAPTLGSRWISKRNIGQRQTTSCHKTVALHHHNQFILLDVSLVKLMSRMFEIENCSLKMAKSGMINNPLSEGVDVTPPSLQSKPNWYS